MVAVQLRSIVQVKTGTRNPTTKPDEEFTYVDVAGVDNIAKVIVSPKVLLGAEAPSRARKLITTGDVLVSTIRPNLNAVALVPESLDGQVASTGFCVLRPTDKVLPQYLYYFVRSPAFVSSLCGLVAGAMYPAVTDGQVLDQLIPLPSLDEQRRIVDILSRAESIVRLRREAQQKAAELVPAIFLDMFGDPATNPKGLKISSLGELCEVKGGGTPSKANPAFWIGNIPWVSPKDMGRSELIFDAEDKISSEAVAGSATNLIPKGALLVVTRSGVLKHSVPCGITSREVAINQDIKAFIPKGQTIENFLLAQFQTRKAEILGLVRVGATVQNIETDALKRLLFLVPGLTDQEAFSAKVDSVRSIQAEMANSSLKAEAAFDSLLGKYF